ncbi:MAG TPA: DtxR family transcriptional regulator [Candidatus Latescibacteria bacterium]|nr:DtxR family transcriptional regulator [Candidatus Latescibacterota bacterium]
MGNEATDELLELLWILREEGEDRLTEVLQAAEAANAEETLRNMAREGLINLRSDRVILRQEGKKRAEEIVRRHRLAERLLWEVLELEQRYIHPEACRFEHILSPEVTESICTLLGHPHICPHGKPIPRGECCTKFKTEVKPLVVRLIDLEAGEEGTITFIVPRSHSRLDRLLALGITPGSVVKLHQKRPSYVIQVGETELAVDDEIAHDIYVKRGIERKGQ